MSKFKFKVGDKVKVIGNTAYHQFKIGDEIVISDTFIWGGYESKGYDIQDSIWRISEEDIELVSSQFIERDGKYNVELTGNEILLIRLLVGSCTGYIPTVNSLWGKIEKLFPEKQWVTVKYLHADIITDYRRLNFEAKSKAVFTKPETQEERHLRELREQYAVLGDKIKQMEVK